MRAPFREPAPERVANRVRLVSNLLGIAVIFVTWAMGEPAIAGTNYLKPGSARLESPLDKKSETPKYQRKGSRIILRSETPLDESWILNAEMSRGCRHGYFKQRADRRYIAVLGAEIYGAAIGGHASLVDRKGLSEPEVVYVFGGQGTTFCRVYHRSGS